ncbi:MAG: TROVE domain-containing protein [Ardenticatenaceae bacterium]|nr:TROVE domain-containing protein [Ardenticatenaceae bacterium]
MTLRHYFSTRKTAQNQPIPGSNQVPNSAGGFTWAVNDWTRLERFLVLGSEGGTYYIQPRQLTVENAEAVLRCVQADGRLVVNRVIEISENGRAPNNDPALFVLAICAGLGDEATRRAALEALPRVARIGTHLFHFLQFVEGFRGWGRGLRRGVANWYTAMPVDRLAYQAVKYQQRDGWSHRDALRLAHPQADGTARNTIFNWITQGAEAITADPTEDVPDGDALRLIWAFEKAKQATDEQAIIELITEFNLPWETIPTEWLASANVWRTLLPRLPMTALLRNLARMTANGTIQPMSAEARLVADRITDADALRRARIHPIAVLAAMKTYEQGHGVRGQLRWEPVTAVLDALDTAFYLAFRNVQPTGKRILLALDVSGSMGWGMVANIPGLTPRVASAAMALVTARVEPQFGVVAFADKMVRLNISPRMRLDDVLKATAGIPFGGTDCALPMIWALQNRVAADAFVIYTDSETWAGRHMHPAQALQEYRQKMGIAAKLVVVGMVSNGFTIADPNDGGMLDVVGFDTAAPQLMADFIGA